MAWHTRRGKCRLGPVTLFLLVPSWSSFSSDSTALPGRLSAAVVFLGSIRWSRVARRISASLIKSPISPRLVTLAGVRSSQGQTQSVDQALQQGWNVRITCILWCRASRTKSSPIPLATMPPEPRVVGRLLANAVPRVEGRLLSGVQPPEPPPEAKPCSKACVSIGVSACNPSSGFELRGRRGRVGIQASTSSFPMASNSSTVTASAGVL